MRLEELAKRVDGRVVGDGSVEIHRMAPIEEAGPGEISFISNPKYKSHLRTTRASAVIVDSEKGLRGCHAIVVRNPYLAVAKILHVLVPASPPPAGVSSMAFMDRSATVAPDASIHPFVVVGAGASVGARTVLYPHVFVGEEVTIGADCILYPGVTVMKGSSVGDRVILHPGVVIGSDGFGFAYQDGKFVKVPQVGTAAVSDDVEIGSNSAVDRGSVGVTRIGKGVKMDNLIQVGHNVVIGDDTVVVAQTGFAGSSKIGRGVQIGGQAGVGGHLVVGDGARLAGRAGVIQDVGAGETVGGFPAGPHQLWLKTSLLIRKLPELFNEVKTLRARLGDSGAYSRRVKLARRPRKRTARGGRRRA